MWCKTGTVTNMNFGIIREALNEIAERIQKN